MSQRTKVTPKGANFKATCLPIPFADPVISTISPAKLFLHRGNIQNMFSMSKKIKNFRYCSNFRMLLKLNMISQVQAPLFCCANPETQYVTSVGYWLKKKKRFKQQVLFQCSSVQVQNTLLKTCFVKAALLVRLKQMSSSRSYGLFHPGFLSFQLCF